MQEVQQVLVAIDRSAMSLEALKQAIAIAETKSAQLIVVHVIEPLFIQSPLAHPADTEQIRQHLLNEIDRLNTAANVEYMLFIESGQAAETIILQVRKTQADLIVVGSHGKDDLESNYFGSTTLKLIQKTHIPVLVVKNRSVGVYRNVIAPTNLSECSKESILFANRLFPLTRKKYLYAFETISNLQALTYQISQEEAQRLRQIKAADAAEGLRKFISEVGEGEMELIDYTASVNEDLLEKIKAEQGDLLVLGSKGVGNLNSFVFGSTASYLVQRSPMDVLVYVPSKS